MNTTVTTTGLSVTATATKSLLISTVDAETGFGPSAILAADNGMAEKIYPVTGAATVGTFKKLTAEDMKHVNPDGSIASGYTAVYESTTTDYFHDKVWLSVDTAGVATDVSYTIKVTTEATVPDEIYKAMRVGFIVDDASTMTTVEITALDTDITATLFNDADGTGVTNIDIYVWIEGTDSDCYNANAMNLNDFDIALNFSIPTT